MKTVLITGASRGIGKDIALRFAAGGWGVAVNYNSSEDAAKELIGQIRQTGGNAVMLKADVSDEKQTAAMFENARKYFGKGIDALVNNAAVPLYGLLCDYGLENIKRLFDVNVFGAFNCARQALPYMISKKSGRIINISSVWGIAGASCETYYSASKAALIGFTKALAKEVAPCGINVNCIAPGAVETDMISNLSQEEKQQLINDIPLKRLGRGEEIAALALFLASDGANYITGQVINISGGLVI
jgi:3-oxoacyl-[acyl-carrier protein] reductase